MGNYLTVKCATCHAEIKAEFREDLLKPQMIELDGCFNCSTEAIKEDAYEDGWDAGFEAGKEDVL